MIVNAQIAQQPISGMYEEKIFDAPTFTEQWAWVKFENDLDETFYGQFKGKAIDVTISTNNSYYYVLTESFLYEINRENITEYNVRDYYDAGRSIRNVTLTPKGDLLLSDYYSLFTIRSPLCYLSGELTDALVEIESPFHLDNIVFKGWDANQLYIHAEIFLTSQPIELFYNSLTNKLIQQK